MVLLQKSGRFLYIGTVLCSHCLIVKCCSARSLSYLNDIFSIVPVCVEREVFAKKKSSSEMLSLIKNISDRKKSHIMFPVLLTHTIIRGYLDLVKILLRTC